MSRTERKGTNLNCGAGHREFNESLWRWSLTHGRVALLLLAPGPKFYEQAFIP